MSLSREDSERLVRIEMGLEALTEAVKVDVVKRLNNHGARINALEVLKYKAIGFIVAAGIAYDVGKEWIHRKLLALH